MVKPELELVKTEIENKNIEGVKICLSWFNYGYEEDLKQLLSYAKDDIMFLQSVIYLLAWYNYQWIDEMTIDQGDIQMNKDRFNYIKTRPDLLELHLYANNLLFNFSDSKVYCTIM